MSRGTGAGLRQNGLAWLFVDILLVLLLVQMDHGSPAPSVQTSSLPSLDEETQLLVFDNPGFDPVALMRDDATERTRVLDRVRSAARPLAGRRAGVVLVFGTVMSGNSPDGKLSTEYSSAIIRILAKSGVELFPSRTGQYRPYIDRDRSDGALTIELFLYQ